MHSTTRINDKRGASMNRDLIESYAAAGEVLKKAVQGLSPADLFAHPGPGNWSIQELVIHLADSDAIAIRLPEGQARTVGQTTFRLRNWRSLFAGVESIRKVRCAVFPGFFDALRRSVSVKLLGIGIACALRWMEQTKNRKRTIAR
jgi:DinB superfamily